MRRTVGVLQYFLVPLVLNSGTGRPAGATYFFNIYVYNTFFSFQNVSYGATLAWLLFVVILVCSNLIGPAKIAQMDLPVVGVLTFGAGVLFFPISYVFGDILTEVYGYARSRRVIWAGFAALAFAFVDPAPCPTHRTRRIRLRHEGSWPGLLPGPRGAGDRDDGVRRSHIVDPCR